MINIAIVEDEAVEAERLSEYLRRYEKETGGTKFHIVRFADGISFLTNYKAEYDIIFMDIEMPDLDGMATAHKLRIQDPGVILVFVTNMAQFAVKGYEVDAMDFMVKPVPYDNFRLKVARAIKKLEYKRDDKLVVYGRTGASVVMIPKIRYVEVVNHMLTFYTVEGAVSATGTLKNIEEKLVGRGFSRANSCYLVNLDYVTGYEDGIAELGQDRLSVSRSHRKQFMKDIADHLGGKT